MLPINSRNEFIGGSPHFGMNEPPMAWIDLRPTQTNRARVDSPLAQGTTGGGCQALIETKGAHVIRQGVFAVEACPGEIVEQDRGRRICNGPCAEFVLHVPMR